MRTFAESYPDEKFVQQVVAQIPWGHSVRILDYVLKRERRAGVQRIPHKTPGIGSVG